MIALGSSCYAHSSDRLFRVDPGSLNVVEVGRFHRRGVSPQMPVDGVTDIAVDKRRPDLRPDHRRAAGGRRDSTAGCTVITALPAGRKFNGLSWVRGEGPGA